MAVLTPDQRQEVRHLIGQKLSLLRNETAMTKAEWLAAINATDGWIEANAASFNSALPLPVRTVLSVTEKEELFSQVAKMRYSR